MTPEDLEKVLYPLAKHVLQQHDATLDLRAEDVTVERPKSREHGDWATNLAMRYAKNLGVPPRQLATELAESFQTLPEIASVDVAGPGFINITLTVEAAAELVVKVIVGGNKYGQNDAAKGESVNLEFVSANPTGPLHLGHTRWAALGDSLGRILKTSGANIVTEYYINDAGNQMDNFGASVVAAMEGKPKPEDGYAGEYIDDLARQVSENLGSLEDLDPAVKLDTVREEAYRIQLAEIKKSLETFRVDFDVFFSERELHAVNAETGLSKIDEAVERLRKQGHVYDEDDAVWVRTTDFGDDKDRVIRRGNGVYTYYAADAAYYLNKKDRGFFEKIYMLGADHHGYVHRLKALAGAAGDDPNTNISVLIGQFVNLNGARLSKRAGNIIEINDLIDWIGTDSLRFWMSRFPADSPIEIDGEQMRSQSNDNPVFYVQYAHARTRQVARNAVAAGILREDFDGATLTHDSENVLLGVLAEYERAIRMAATLREPHRISRYLETLASAYHRWYDSCRVIPLGEDEITSVHRSRLWLNDATAQVLRNGLDLIGVSAPERM